MELTVLHLYPDLMSLYGSYANLAVLCRLLTAHGHRVTVRAVALGDPLPPLDSVELVYLGAGTERARDAALLALRPYADALHDATAAGLPLLCAGTGLELLGRTLTHADGTAVEGLGIADFAVIEGTRRLVGDVLAESALDGARVVGYQNTCTRLVGVTTPLLRRCLLGGGNDGAGDGEGYHRDAVFGSTLTGPLLVKNPPLLTAVATAVLARRGADIPDAWDIEPHQLAAYEVAVRELTARCTPAAK